MNEEEGDEFEEELEEGDDGDQHWTNGDRGEAVLSPHDT